MTSSPGLLQHRNSASSTPKINLCREVLYPPSLGHTLCQCPPQWLGLNPYGNWDFPAPKQPALLAGAASPGTGMQSWSRVGFLSQLPLCAGVLLDARSLGRQERLWGRTQSSPNASSAKRWHKSLPDGWEVTPLCCLGALKAFST